MNRVALVFAICGALLWGLAFPIAQQLPGSFPPGVFSNTAALSGGGFTPSCTASTNWLARATLVTLTFDKQQYDNLLCGLNTDGVLAKIDTLYIYGAPDSTTAKLNTTQNAFNSTQTGSLTFAAYTGFTGDATTGFLDTGFNPSTAGGQTTQNSATAGVCILSSRATGQLWEAFGASGAAGVITRMLTNFSTNGNIWAINTLSQTITANADAQGGWIETRTGATTTTLYHNGSSFATDTSASAAMPALNMYVFAENLLGTGATQFTGDQQAWFVQGSGFTATDVTNFRSRTNTYLTAYGVTGC